MKRVEPELRELALNATAQSFAPGAQHSAASYEVGAVICRKYRLDEMLGEGGMGSVWRATNLQLDCPVALKLIRAGLDRDDMRIRLKFEARSAARLAHPGIVRVFDVGDSETGDPFIVMELLNGQTLSQASFDAPLSAVRAVQLLLPIAEALCLAHACGIVHRDLKPDNVFIVEEDGRVQPKLVDFGIAKSTDNSGRVGGLTQSGTLIGTPDYMSPEGARGQNDLDARADVWSFCVVLYEQVAGTMPFVADNSYAMLRAIVEDAPRPLSPNITGGEELWEILQRGLAKDRRDRFQSIADVGRALATWLKSQNVHTDACGLSLDTKWLRSDSSLTSARLELHQPAQQRQLGSGSNANQRKPAGRARNLWLSATAALAVAFFGAWSAVGNARLPEKTVRHPSAVAIVVSSAPAQRAPLTPVAETPAPVPVTRQPPAPLRMLPSPAPRAASPAVASAPSVPQKQARSASLDLIAPY